MITDADLFDKVQRSRLRTLARIKKTPEAAREEREVSLVKTLAHLKKPKRVRVSMPPYVPRAGNPQYYYTLKYRPPGVGTCPKGWELVERPRMPGWERRTDLPESKHQFGVISYPRPLTADEMRDYEMESVAPRTENPQGDWFRVRISFIDLSAEPGPKRKEETYAVRASSSADAEKKAIASLSADFDAVAEVKIDHMERMKHPPMRSNPPMLVIGNPLTKKETAELEIDAAEEHKRGMGLIADGQVEEGSLHMGKSIMAEEVGMRYGNPGDWVVKRGGKFLTMTFTPGTGKRPSTFVWWWGPPSHAYSWKSFGEAEAAYLDVLEHQRDLAGDGEIVQMLDYKSNPPMLVLGNPSKDAQDFISEKISKLMHEGYPQKQAIAIAHSMARKAGYRSVPMREKNPADAYTGEWFDSQKSLWDQLDEREANALMAMLRENHIEARIAIDPDPKKFGGHTFSVHLVNFDPTDTYSRMAVEGVANRFAMALSEKRIMKLRDVPGVQYGGGGAYTGAGRRGRRRNANPPKSKFTLTKDTNDLKYGILYDGRDVWWRHPGREGEEGSWSICETETYADALEVLRNSRRQEREGIPWDKIDPWDDGKHPTRFARRGNPLNAKENGQLLGEAKRIHGGALERISDRSRPEWDNFRAYYEQLRGVSQAAKSVFAKGWGEIDRMVNDLYIKGSEAGWWGSALGNPGSRQEFRSPMTKAEARAYAKHRKAGGNMMTWEAMRATGIKKMDDLNAIVGNAWYTAESAGEPINSLPAWKVDEYYKATARELGYKKNPLSPDESVFVRRRVRHFDEAAKSARKLGDKVGAAYATGERDMGYEVLGFGRGISSERGNPLSPDESVFVRRRVRHFDEAAKSARKLGDKVGAAYATGERDMGYEVLGFGRGISSERGMNPDPCPLCGGELVFMGTLGNLDWYNCRACGAEMPISLDDMNRARLAARKKSKSKKGLKCDVCGKAGVDFSHSVGCTTRHDADLPHEESGTEDNTGRRRGKNPQGVPANIENDPKFQRELAAYRRRHKSDPVHVTAISVPKGYPKYMSVYGEIPEAKYDAPAHSVKGKRIHHFGKRGKNRPFLASSTEKGPKFLAIVGGTFKAKTDWLHD